MSSDNWFYHLNGERHGPISTRELSGLAANGYLQRSDMVWKEGMGKWVPASSVGGLFPLEKPPPRPVAPVASPQGESKRATGSSAADSAKRAGKALLSRDLNDFLPHVFLIDGAFKVLKAVLTPRVLDGLDLVARTIGSIAYLGASVLIVWFMMFLALETDNPNLITTAIVAIPVALLLHYTAVQFLKSGKALIDQTPSQLSTDGFLKVFVLVQTVAGGLVLLAGIFAFVQLEFDPKGLLYLSGSVLFFAQSLYAATLGLTPASVNVSISQTSSAGGEAIGIMSFLSKAYLRMVGFVFCVGSVVGLLMMTYFNILLLSLSEALRPGLPDPALLIAFPVSLGVLLLGLLPLWFYVSFLFTYLGIDVVRAILALPGRK